MNSKHKGLFERFSAHIPHLRPLAWGVFLILSALGLLHNYLYYAQFNVAYLEYAELGDLVFAFIDSVVVITDHAWIVAILIAGVSVYVYTLFGYSVPLTMLSLLRREKKNLQAEQLDEKAASEEYNLVSNLLEEAEATWKSASNARQKRSSRDYI